MCCAEDGVGIPREYTSFIAPVSTCKLWDDVRAGKELKGFETPYVVKFHDKVQLAPSKPVFRFEHPNRAPVIDNSRYTAVRFAACVTAVVHGFAGYFEAVLYKDISISINPETFSEGMFSWFPIFFPIRTPVLVEEGDTIELHMWRCVSATKVWYEWAVTSPCVGPIHNPGGRSTWIGL